MSQISPVATRRLVVVEDDDSIRETVAEALAMECANFNLWCGKLKNYDKVRGGRLNGVEPLKHAIRGWNVQRESDDSE